MLDPGTHQSHVRKATPEEEQSTKEWKARAHPSDPLRLKLTCLPAETGKRLVLSCHLFPWTGTPSKKMQAPQLLMELMVIVCLPICGGCHLSRAPSQVINVLRPVQIT